MPQDDSGVALSPTRKQLSVVLKCKGNVCLLRFQNCKTNGSCGRKGSVLNVVLFFFFCKDRNSTPTGLRKKEKDHLGAQYRYHQSRSPSGLYFLLHGSILFWLILHGGKDGRRQLHVYSLPLSNPRERPLLIP